MVDTFNSAIASRNIRTVRISSQGGQAAHAMKIAEGMVAGGMDVVVDKACIGTCAQYILVAGRNRPIEDDALVAFHISFAGYDAIIATLPDLPAQQRRGHQWLQPLPDDLPDVGTLEKNR